MLTLRPDQVALKAGTYKSWDDGSPATVAVAPTGFGKTVVMSSMADDFNGVPTAAIAHRQELVQQIALAMMRMDKPHRIIASDKTIKTIIQQQIAECGMHYVHPKEALGVIGVDTLIRQAVKDPMMGQWANTVKHWMGDECFPAGTLIDGRPIEKLKVGDLVKAFDDMTGNVKLSRITRTFKNPAPQEMIDIRAGDRSLQCTPNHPILTWRGWVEAVSITVDDHIRTEDGLARVSKVNRVTGPFDGFVYNIEVDEFHTYIANGVVVHNCHHFLADNKWGRGVKLFENAVGVGFTATPIRCDRKSLHVSQGGVFHDMVVGPSLREVINRGDLCDYRIFGPPQSIKTEDLKVSQATGDFSAPSMRAAAEQSTITGDIVQHYLKIAPGKRGITFTVDVESADKVAAAFNAAGVTAASVSAKTPDSVRNELIRKFRDGKIMQLVNVDLFGEGFDVPAVEVVSMGRPTQSFGLYVQQFGRALRTDRASGKTHGIIIDHVGNVKRHGLPDAHREWSLMADESGRRGTRDPDVMPVTTCTECFEAYEAVTKACPHCGHVPEPESRGEPRFVDGDLIEFDEALLQKLRGEINRIDGEVRVPAHLRGTPAERAIARQHGQRQLAQEDLRQAIALWAGVRRDKGMSDSEIYRRFYHTFGLDILSSQALDGISEIEQLANRVKERYWNV